MRTQCSHGGFQGRTSIAFTRTGDGTVCSRWPTYIAHSAGQPSPSTLGLMKAVFSPAQAQLLTKVNQNPWIAAGHVLYPSAICLSRFLQEKREQLVEGKTVLELGAGAGLPGLASAVLGAKLVRENRKFIAIP
jgi:Lysine methyltransferase